MQHNTSTKQEQAPTIDPLSKDLGITIKRLRKCAKLTQSDICRLLRLQQAAISRVEAGRQNLTPEHLAVLARHFRVSIDELLFGRVNYWRVAEEFNQAPPYPPRYRAHPYSKIREILPFVHFMNTQFGADYTHHQLAKFKLDSALFKCPDQNIGVNFLLDLVRDLIGTGKLDREIFEKLIMHTRGEDAHGHLHKTYALQQSAIQVIQARVVNARHYENNFQYEIENMNGNSIELSVSPASHMSEVNYKDKVLGDFLCRYRKSYFRDFPLYIDQKPAIITEKTCHFHSGERKCVYSIRAS